MTTTNDRQVLFDVAEQSGWQRKELERTDVYSRGGRRIEVLFTADALNGGTLYEDLHLLTHTREIATVEKWLQRAM